jgi:intracellular sulfur oxidation DsrE/DsrF family protein
MESRVAQVALHVKDRDRAKLLRRNLVHAMIGCAKRLVVLVVEGNALDLAIEGRPEVRRWSRLLELLQA